MLTLNRDSKENKGISDSENIDYRIQNTEWQNPESKNTVSALTTVVGILVEIIIKNKINGCMYK